MRPTCRFHVSSRITTVKSLVHKNVQSLTFPMFFGVRALTEGVNRVQDDFSQINPNSESLIPDLNFHPEGHRALSNAHVWPEEF